MATDQSGVSDHVVAVLTSDGLTAVAPPPPTVLPRSPAESTFEFRVRITWPTSEFVNTSYTADPTNLLRRHLDETLFLRGNPVIEVELLSSDVERRFEVIDNGGDYEVWDNHARNMVAIFNAERHAHHYADALERKPSLVDDDV